MNGYATCTVSTMCLLISVHLSPHNQALVAADVNSHVTDPWSAPVHCQLSYDFLEAGLHKIVQSTPLNPYHSVVVATALAESKAYALKPTTYRGTALRKVIDAIGDDLSLRVIYRGEKVFIDREIKSEVEQSLRADAKAALAAGHVSDWAAILDRIAAAGDMGLVVLALHGLTCQHKDLVQLTRWWLTESPYCMVYATMWAQYEAIAVHPHRQAELVALYTEADQWARQRLLPAIDDSRCLTAIPLLLEDLAQHTQIMTTTGRQAKVPETHRQADIIARLAGKLHTEQLLQWWEAALQRDRGSHWRGWCLDIPPAIHSVADIIRTNGDKSQRERLELLWQEVNQSAEVQGVIDTNRSKTKPAVLKVDAAWRMLFAKKTKYTQHRQAVQALKQVSGRSVLERLMPILTSTDSKQYSYYTSTSAETLFHYHLAHVSAESLSDAIRQQVMTVMRRMLTVKALQRSEIKPHESWRVSLRKVVQDCLEQPQLVQSSSYALYYHWLTFANPDLLLRIDMATGLNNESHWRTYFSFLKLAGTDQHLDRLASYSDSWADSKRGAIAIGYLQQIPCPQAEQSWQRSWQQLQANPADMLHLLKASKGCGPRHLSPAKVLQLASFAYQSDQGALTYAADHGIQSWLGFPLNTRLGLADISTMQGMAERFSKALYKELQSAQPNWKRLYESVCQIARPYGGSAVVAVRLHKLLATMLSSKNAKIRCQAAQSLMTESVLKSLAKSTVIRHATQEHHPGVKQVMQKIIAGKHVDLRKWKPPARHEGGTRQQGEAADGF